MSTITSIQYHTARTLAAALGHRWALLDATAEVATPTTPSDIRAVSILALLDAGDDDAHPGILAPRMDGDAIRHISATGSIRYVVHDDGSAQIILRDDVSGWYIAHVYAEVAAACVALAAQGRRIDISRGRPSYRDDLAWGVRPEIVRARVVAYCLDMKMTKDEAAEYFSGEVASDGRAIEAFLDSFRAALACRPTADCGPQVEVIGRRTSMTPTEADLPRRPEWTED